MNTGNEETGKIIQLRGGLASVLRSVNPLPARREIMVEIDTGQLKAGDGIKRWNELPYVGVSSAVMPNEKTYGIILTDSYISQKYISLPDNCDTTKPIELFIQSFPTERDIDWELNGNKISWDGLELDGFAQAGDKVFIKYYY